jgi:transcriptional regulator of acetoin/glycerol metabolism
MQGGSPARVRVVTAHAQQEDSAVQSGETSMELKALSRLGWSVTALAREYGLSRTTVYKELASAGPRSYGRAKPTELIDVQRIHVGAA